MLKCKCCGKSDFGVTLKEIKVTPVKMVNGEAVAILSEPETSQDYEVNFCFTCNKPITQDDLYENETCPVCGKEVPELVNGVCPHCNEEKNKLMNMSQEELILMLLKQQNGVSVTAPSNAAPVNDTPAQEEVAPEKEEKAETEKKKRKERVKETKEVVEEEVVAAKEEVKSSVSNVDMPDSVGAPSESGQLESVPVNNVAPDMPALTDDADDILRQLDSIDIGNLGIENEPQVGPF